MWRPRYSPNDIGTFVGAARHAEFEDHRYRLVDIPNTIRAATIAGVILRYGSFQIYDPTVGPLCDMYWMTIDAPEREEGEPWIEYVSRANQSTLEQFMTTWTTSDWASIILNEWSNSVYPMLLESGGQFENWICCELYFETESGLDPLSDADGS